MPIGAPQHPARGEGADAEFAEQGTVLGLRDVPAIFRQMAGDATGGQRVDGEDLAVEQPAGAGCLHPRGGGVPKPVDPRLQRRGERRHGACDANVDVRGDRVNEVLSAWADAITRDARICARIWCSGDRFMLLTLERAGNFSLSWR